MDWQIESVIENISGASFTLGKIKGMEEVATKLLERSGSLFSMGRDGEAEFLRGIANEIKSSTSLLFDSYQKSEHKDSQNCWESLESMIGHVQIKVKKAKQ